MILIVGLGNPGEKYQNTRHNVGFMVIDELKKELNLAEFDFDKKSNSFFSKNSGILLVKPDTYMNMSGKAVNRLSDYYKIKRGDEIIVHDDIDLLIGKIKISKDRGSAGHKGVESVIKGLGTKDFIRIRIGIGPISGRPKKNEDFVLKRFSKEEKPLIKQAVVKSVQAIRKIMEEGPEKAMNIFNN